MASYGRVSARNRASAGAATFHPAYRAFCHDWELQAQAEQVHALIRQCSPLSTLGCPRHMPFCHDPTACWSAAPM
jgi:hypothetical protein